MNQELIVSVCVAAFTVGIMLLFYLDLVKRSYMLIQPDTSDTIKAKNQSKSKGGNAEADTDANSLIPDKQLAYPFYTAYIHSENEISNLGESAYLGEGSRLNFRTLAEQPAVNNSKIS